MEPRESFGKQDARIRVSHNFHSTSARVPHDFLRPRRFIRLCPVGLKVGFARAGVREAPNG